ncbi:hypothetical protein D9M69_592310 [compost metagenome]
MNSWPIGRPAKRGPWFSLGRLTENEGLRWLSSRLSVSVTSGETSATSFSSDSISPEALLSSSEATISIGCVARSR